MPQPPILRTSLPTTHAASASASSTQPSQSPSPSTPKTKTTTTNKHKHQNVDPRHMAIALHHAHQIQSQKDTEALILTRILDLIALPSSSSSASASHPTTTDIQTLKSALAPFQPADYDNLLHERNIEGKCGYPLCPNDHRSDTSAPAPGSSGSGSSSFRITWGAKGSGPHGRGREMKIVLREQYEMWCCDECAERAMYIRVQLAAEPVWERRGDSSKGAEIELLEEGRGRAQNTKGKGKAATVREVTGQMQGLAVDGDGDGGAGEQDVVEGMAGLAVGEEARARELAMERGDASPALRAGRVHVDLCEKERVGGMARAPSMRPGDDRGGSIEGYTPRER